MRDYLTLTEAAELLDVSRPTVWRWITSGTLNAYRVGTRWRIKPQDVQHMLGEEGKPQLKGKDFTKPPEKAHE